MLDKLWDSASFHRTNRMGESAHLIAGSDRVEAIASKSCLRMNRMLRHYFFCVRIK